jgi:hypothetical protein
MESTQEDTNLDDEEFIEEETDEIIFVEGPNKDEEDEESEDENDLANTLSQLNITEAKVTRSHAKIRFTASDNQ